MGIFYRLKGCTIMLDGFSENQKSLIIKFMKLVIEEPDKIAIAPATCKKTGEDKVVIFACEENESMEAVGVLFDVDEDIKELYDFKGGLEEIPTLNYTEEDNKSWWQHLLFWRH